MIMLIIKNFALTIAVVLMLWAYVQSQKKNYEPAKINLLYAIGLILLSIAVD